MGNEYFYQHHEKIALFRYANNQANLRAAILIYPVALRGQTFYAIAESTAFIAVVSFLELIKNLLPVVNAQGFMPNFLL